MSEGRVLLFEEEGLRATAKAKMALSLVVIKAASALDRYETVEAE